MRWRASVPTRTWSSWGHFLTKKSIRKSTTTPLRSLLTTKRSANRALSRASPKSSTSMKIWAWRMKIPMDRNLTMSSETSLKSMTTIFHGTKSMSMTCIECSNLIFISQYAFLSHSHSWKIRSLKDEEPPSCSGTFALELFAEEEACGPI